MQLSGSEPGTAAFYFSFILYTIQRIIKVAISLHSLSGNVKANTVIKQSGGIYVVNIE